MSKNVSISGIDYGQQVQDGFQPTLSSKALATSKTYSCYIMFTLSIDSAIRTTLQTSYPPTRFLLQAGAPAINPIQ